MDFSAGTLFASLLVSTLGMGFFMYGKKQIRMPQLTTGIALMAFPYFVGGALPIVGIASAILLVMHLALRSGA
ncbi:MAG: hypothetical protein ACI8X5_002402 [Planctomycetota bacterium]|jgi:hypothetical protein